MPLCPRNAIDLDVERAMPRRHADKAARRRIMRKISCIDGVDRGEMRRISAIHIAFDDIIERGTRRRKTKLHLFENDLGLAFDRQALDFAGRRVVGRRAEYSTRI